MPHTLKKLFSLAALHLFSSCTNSGAIESQAQRIAAMYCSAQKMLEQSNSQNRDAAIRESELLSRRAMELTTEFGKKHTEKELRQLNDAVLDKMKSCK